MRSTQQENPSGILSITEAVYIGLSKANRWDLSLPLGMTRGVAS